MGFLCVVHGGGVADVTHGIPMCCAWRWSGRCQRIETVDWSVEADKTGAQVNDRNRMDSFAVAESAASMSNTVLVVDGQWSMALLYLPKRFPTTHQI